MQKFVLIDVETGNTLKVNFEWDSFERGMASAQGSQPAAPAPVFREPRRKKIYGRRGEHKEQD